MSKAIILQLKTEKLWLTALKITKKTYSDVKCNHFHTLAILHTHTHTQIVHVKTGEIEVRSIPLLIALYQYEFSGFGCFSVAQLCPTLSTTGLLAPYDFLEFAQV